jgi:hypothetical protein
MRPEESLTHEWPYLLSFLPAEEVLDESAKAWGAIRRKRLIDRGSQLLRLALVYSFCGFSLRETAAWAEAANIASLSDVALLNRLRNAADWLGHLLAVKLAERIAPIPPNATRVRLIDATTVTAPGSKGVDWRVHLDFDLGSTAISEIQVTGSEGGESLFRWEFEPGELVVADRGYSRRPELAHLHESGARFIVRLNWSTVPLRDPGGEAFDLLGALRNLPEAQAGSFDLEIQPDPKHDIAALPVRLVAVRKSEDAAEEARRKVLEEASRKGKKVQPKTLKLAGYVLLVTSTCEDDLSPEDVLGLYRFRWQIELVFKRLKSLLQLDHLSAKNPQLTRTYLYAKLLGAILLEDLSEGYVSFSPWGYRIRPPAPALPLAHSARAAG